MSSCLLSLLRSINDEADEEALVSTDFISTLSQLKDDVESSSKMAGVENQVEK